MNDVDRVRQEVKRLQARHGLHVPAGTEHNIHYAKCRIRRIWAFVGSAWQWLSVFLVLVLLLRIVPLVDSIENFEALRDTIQSNQVCVGCRCFRSCSQLRLPQPATGSAVILCIRQLEYALFMVKTNSGSCKSESAEVAESYNQWLREKIERAIADTRPAIPHDQVVARVQARIDAARIRRKAAED